MFVGSLLILTGNQNGKKHSKNYLLSSETTCSMRPRLYRNIHHININRFCVLIYIYIYSLVAVAT